MAGPATKSRLGLLIGVALWLAAITVGIALWVGGRAPAIADHVDLSSPIASTKSFLQCLAAGHAVDVFACVIGDSEQQQFARGLSEAIDAGLIIDDLSVLPQVDPSALDNASVAIDGDRAVITVPDDVEPRQFVLVRVGDQWKVDLLASTNLSREEAVAYLDRLRNASDYRRGGE